MSAIGSSSNRRIPKILADELEEAFANLSEFGPYETMRMLKRYRANRVVWLANKGLNGPSDPDWYRTISAGIPTARALLDVQKLDEVFHKLHEFRKPGGADLYGSRALKDSYISERQAGFARKAKGRSAKVSSEKIANWLQSKGYATADYKTALVMDAMSYFAVSKGTITNAISKHGLARKKKKGI